MTLPEPQPTEANRDPALWAGIYRKRGAEQVSWFQPEAHPSLDLIQSIPSADSIVDVGGGASTLVDGLLQIGYVDVTVLDLSTDALQLARRRLGRLASTPRWIQADVLDWEPNRTFDIWHDRAVFHFLTTSEERARYLAVVAEATHPGSTLIVGTFAPDGPERCSGLPVARYSADDLAAEFASDWRLNAACRHVHTTPAGIEQPFTWASLARK